MWNCLNLILYVGNAFVPEKIYRKMIQLHNMFGILLNTLLNTINDLFTYVLFSILADIAKDLSDLFSSKTNKIIFHHQ